MKIESVDVTVFQYPTRRVSDAAGHSHPGPESMATGNASGRIWRTGSGEARIS